MKYLDKIKSPDDFKNFTIPQLVDLCAEIRQVIVDAVSKNGGHLASNLGTVELTVAMLKAFPSVKNRIVWDVGHQSYTHKILTGRYNEIDTIRTQGGLSGFPKRNESEYDAFNAGHSSTSISAAYGISKAKELKGEDGYTIAVIGDGALTGGLAYEGLNNAGRSKKNFIVVLNDNKMSISRNVGSVAKYLTGIRIKPAYIRIKNKCERTLTKIPVFGNPIRKILKRSKLRVRKMVYKDTLFDDMGFVYYGPVEGHNLEELENAFNAAKGINGPVLIHVVTTKGKGYQYAENDPKNFHGVSSFDVESGEPISSKKGFSTVFGEKLCALAAEDKRICAITAAMKSGTGLSDFAKKYKDRFFDVGIAEEHAITFASGLAAGGMLPVFAVYSTFLQRGIDQLIHDAATQKLHIILAIDRAGIVGEDGETHQGVFDVPLLNSIPNVEIYSPCYFDELERDLLAATHSSNGVIAVRYPRGAQLYKPEDFSAGKKTYDVYAQLGAEIAIVTYGRLFSYACLAQSKLKKDGISISVIKLNRIKPIPKEAIVTALSYKHIFFFEESMETGGIGEHMLCELVKNGYTGTYKLTGIDNRYVQHASVKASLAALKLDDKGMTEVINNSLKRG
ncbi:MAG: 1-deoxy-D-xylulose-5-phosphate synthase [Acutalibacteraceae bacterium]